MCGNMRMRNNYSGINKEWRYIEMGIKEMIDESFRGNNDERNNCI